MWIGRGTAFSVTGLPIAKRNVTREEVVMDEAQGIVDYSVNDISSSTIYGLMNLVSLYRS